MDPEFKNPPPQKKNRSESLVDNIIVLVLNSVNVIMVLCIIFVLRKYMLNYIG